MSIKLQREHDCITRLVTRMGVMHEMRAVLAREHMAQRVRIDHLKLTFTDRYRSDTPEATVRELVARALTLAPDNRPVYLDLVLCREGEVNHSVVLLFTRHHDEVHMEYFDPNGDCYSDKQSYLGFSHVAEWLRELFPWHITNNGGMGPQSRMGAGHMQRMVDTGICGLFVTVYLYNRFRDRAAGNVLQLFHRGTHPRHVQKFYFDMMDFARGVLARVNRPWLGAGMFRWFSEYHRLHFDYLIALRCKYGQLAMMTRFAPPPQSPHFARHGAMITRVQQIARVLALRAWRIGHTMYACVRAHASAAYLNRLVTILELPHMSPTPEFFSSYSDKEYSQLFVAVEAFISNACNDRVVVWYS